MEAGLSATKASLVQEKLFCVLIVTPFKIKKIAILLATIQNEFKCKTPLYSVISRDNVTNRYFLNFMQSIWCCSQELCN